MSARRYRWLFRCGIAFGLTAGSLLAGASPAFAEGDLDVRSDTTYTVDGDAGLVRVSATVSVTNNKADQRVEGGIRFFYYSGYSLPIPARATNVTAMSSNGKPLAVETRIYSEGEYVAADVTFARNLRRGNTETFTLTYDLEGDPPRSDEPTRINRALASFAVIGWGDPGQATVKVVVPDSYDVQLEGDDLTQGSESGATVYSSGPIDAPDDWWAYITAQDPERLASNEITVGDARFHIRSWPGDTEWNDFATKTVTDGLPVLEQLVGEEWPHTGVFTIDESYSPYLYGYAGWYDGAGEQIEVVEEIDPGVMLHELSHAWFNDKRFASRWISEGLADAVADEALAKLGLNRMSRPTVTADDAAAFPLSSWADPVGSTKAEIRAEEQYGYGASQLVMSSILSQLGDDGLQKVFDAVEAGTIPYPGEGADTTVGAGFADWRRFLDLVQMQGADTTIEQLMRTWVVTDDEAKLLDARAASRATYDDLQEAGDDWAVPVGVRRAMASWQFEWADTTMAAARDVLEARDALDARATELGLKVPDDMEDAYEDVAHDDFAAITDRFADYRATADAIESTTALLAVKPSTMERIGLRGQAPEADLAAARTAFESGNLDESSASLQRARATRAGAAELGRRQAWRWGATAGGSLVGVLTLGVLARSVVKRRRRRRVATSDAIDQVASQTDGTPAIATVDEFGEPVLSESLVNALVGAGSTSAHPLAPPSGPPISRTLATPDDPTDPM